MTQHMTPPIATEPLPEEVPAPCLLAVVGSVAYGLATPDSDVDVAGFFVTPTEQILGLTRTPETYHGTSETRDYTLHELGKAARLLIKANPSAIELLFCDDYEVLDDDGALLVTHRRTFLCTDSVRSAFAGYVISQAKALVRRDGTFSSHTAKRTAKHARHCLRLLDQGHQLLTTGALERRVSDPETLFARADRAVTDPARFREEAIAAANSLYGVDSALPDSVDLDAVSRLLVTIRRRHLGPAVA